MGIYHRDVVLLLFKVRLVLAVLDIHLKISRHILQEAFDVLSLSSSEFLGELEFVAVFTITLGSLSVSASSPF